MAGESVKQQARPQPSQADALADAVMERLKPWLEAFTSRLLAERPDKPETYLLANGWTPEGDPHAPHTLWLDPQRRLKPTSEEVVIGRPTGADGVPVVLKQTLITPAGVAMSVGEAVWKQKERDQHKATK